MISDRLDNDICPARKLGMTTVWIKQGFAIYQDVEIAECKPDYIVDGLSDLIGIF